jgi:hypothetical protein
MKEEEVKRTVKIFLIAALGAGSVVGVKQAAAIDGKFSMGTEFSYLKYEEPDVMEEKGPMYGIYGEYTLRGQENKRVESWADIFSGYNDNYMFGVDAKLAIGQVDYDSRSTGSIDNIDEVLAEVRGVAGYDFPILEDTVITPYIGVGYRFLADGLGGKTSSTGHLGYDRESHDVYLPIGFMTDSTLNDRWHWGFGLEYDVFLQGTQKSHLEDLDPSLSMLENDQEKGFGACGSLLFTREAESLDLVFGPFIRYWDIDESNIGTITCGGVLCAAGYEPKNESVEYGVKVGAKF